MTRRQSLRQALRIWSTPGTDLSRCGLRGCPVGGWGETEQAWRAIAEALPRREDRTYTISQFVAAAYYVDAADRWQPRAEEGGAL